MFQKSFLNIPNSESTLSFNKNTLMSTKVFTFFYVHHFPPILSLTVNLFVSFWYDFQSTKNSFMFCTMFFMSTFRIRRLLKICVLKFFLLVRHSRCFISSVFLHFISCSFLYCKYLLGHGLAIVSRLKFLITFL